jgi:hypothetical protein
MPRIPTSRPRRGPRAQILNLGGSRTTCDRAGTSRSGLWVLASVWPLPSWGSQVTVTAGQPVGVGAHVIDPGSAHVIGPALGLQAC